MSDSQSVLTQCIELLNYEQEVRLCKSEIELSFLMVNRSSLFINAALVVYWQRSPSGKITIKRASNISQIDVNTTPLLQKIEQLCATIVAQKNQQVRELQSLEISELHLEQFYNWNNTAVLWCPLKFTEHTDRQGNLSADQYKKNDGLVFLRDKPWNNENIVIASRLSEMYGFALQVLSNKPSRYQNFYSFLKKPLLLIIVLTGMMFLPVRQSVIAPATIIATQPDVVTAPIDGVIEEIKVTANEIVTNNQILLKFDQSSIKNRYEVATKILKVSQAKYHKAQQLSFNNSEMKAQLALLKAQMEQRSAEVSYAKQLLERTVVRATRAGIAIIDDINSLTGKPVLVGERIMTIADPEQFEIEIELPINDAIIMTVGAEVDFFLNIAPANALSAELYYVGYSANVTTQGVLAYRLLARFRNSRIDNVAQITRIGLKGSAKIYGQEVSLFYYLFRRPLSVLRQTLGI